MQDIGIIVFPNGTMYMALRRAKKLGTVVKLTGDKLNTKYRVFEDESKMLMFEDTQGIAQQLLLDGKSVFF